MEWSVYVIQRYSQLFILNYLSTSSRTVPIKVFYAAVVESGRKRKRTSPSQSPAEVGSGFKAINSRRESQRSTYNLDSDATPEAESLPMFVSEEEELPKRNGKGKNAVQGLVVHIPEKEVARALRKPWEDFTIGGDRIRRVLRERYDDDVTVLYKVQFDDYRNEEVCS